MVDPAKISNFNLTNDELEEVLLFWVCAAGKNGKTTARLLGTMLDELRFLIPNISSPFQLIRQAEENTTINGLSYDWLVYAFKRHGIGNYTLKARTFRALVESRLDLKTCTAQELDDIIGIGPKTARAFIVHSRPNQRYAIIDTHLLKYLGSLGHKVPKSTPTTKIYNILEQVFLNICDEHKVEPHELDLAIWNHYSSRSQGHFDIEKWKANK